MKTLRECLAEARAKKVAIGHFNISNLEALWGIFNAAKSLELPVIIGLSDGERDFVGVRQAVALVKSLRDQYNLPIFINADHTSSFERYKEVVDAGFDAAMFDGSELPLAENIKITKQCVDYARAKNPEIITEGEIGFIGKSSKIHDVLPAGVQLSAENLTKPEEAQKFVEETGVDLLAPAVGNFHGMLRGGKDPSLNIGRIKEISETAKIPLVLHGGSGNSPAEFQKAIDVGVAIVHINTELRVAYRQALQKSLQENLEETTPYKYLKEPMKAVQKVVEEKLKIFNKV
ncbi:MAG: class II fructose-bisphosphate aldolase [Candidatus Paceibacterota bacterium]|jgi:fructose-bisphosphate aldolase class II